MKKALITGKPNDVLSLCFIGENFNVSYKYGVKE